MTDEQAAASAAPTWRIAPSIPVAFGVFVAYSVVFIGLSGSSLIPYDDWFDSSANIFRAAVLPLAAGALLLILFLLWARWDFVFRDPERLPLPGFLRALLVLYVVFMVAVFAVADWGSVGDKLLPILLAGLLVGFAEELLFRGIILRALRTKLRPEAWVILISSVWFGAFHLLNVITGLNPVSAVFQMFIAAAGGVFLYMFRRFRGVLVLPMIVHALWDAANFLPQPTGSLANVGRIIIAVVVISAIAAIITMIRSDRRITVTPQGIEQLPAA